MAVTAGNAWTKRWAAAGALGTLAALGLWAWVSGTSGWLIDAARQRAAAAGHPLATHAAWRAMTVGTGFFATAAAVDVEFAATADGARRGAVVTFSRPAALWPWTVTGYAEGTYRTDPRRGGRQFAPQP